jgi:hypothetical protein
MVSSTASQVEKSESEYDAARKELDRMQEEAHAALDELERKWDDAAQGIVEMPVRPGKTGAEVVELGLFWVPK